MGNETYKRNSKSKTNTQIDKTFRVFETTQPNHLILQIDTTIMMMTLIATLAMFAPVWANRCVLKDPAYLLKVEARSETLRRRLPAGTAQAPVPAASSAASAEAAPEEFWTAKKSAPAKPATTVMDSTDLNHEDWLKIHPEHQFTEQVAREFKFSDDAPAKPVYTVKDSMNLSNKEWLDKHPEHQFKDDSGFKFQIQYFSGSTSSGTSQKGRRDYADITQEMTEDSDSDEPLPEGWTRHIKDDTYFWRSPEGIDQDTEPSFPRTEPSNSGWTPSMTPSQYRTWMAAHPNMA